MKIFANAVDIATFGAAPIGVVLIGSFAGYANYGDILQFLSLYELYTSELPDAKIATVIEAEALDRWRDNIPGHVLKSVIPFYSTNEILDRTDSGRNEDWSDRLVFPQRLILHFYGGGYITTEWGPRKRLSGEFLLAACEDAGVKTSIYFTGIQVSPGQEAHQWHRLLSMAEVIGVRDCISLNVCSQVLGPGSEDKAFLQGDDALPVISRMVQKVPRPEKPAIGIHVNTAYYSTSVKLERFKALARVLESLHGHVGEDSELVNLIAYEDANIDERIDQREFFEYLNGSHQALPLKWPLSFRSLVEDVKAERIPMPFTVVISCSYHVTYTALACGIPVIFLIDNDYYEQKASGLREYFDSNRLHVLGHGASPSDIADGIQKIFHRSGGHQTGKDWLGLLRVRDRIMRSLHQLYCKYTDEDTDAILTVSRNNALALAELKRRVILMERYEANLEAEIAHLKGLPVIGAPAKKVSKLKREWRRVRERLGLRKRRDVPLFR